jgi:alpha-glucosidase (family GH31 glycosyl hydrolase)
MTHRRCVDRNPPTRYNTELSVTRHPRPSRRLKRSSISRPAPRRLLIAALAVCSAFVAPAEARTLSASAGPDGRVVVRDGDRALLREAATGAPGRFALRVGGRWYPATGVVARAPLGVDLTLRTAAPGAPTLRVTGAPDGEGALRLTALAAPEATGVEAVGVSFAAEDGERYLGLGQRSDAVDQRGREVLARVEEGPYLPGDYPLVRAAVPGWALRASRAASSYPIPWVLSTRGVGVLVDEDRDSRFRLRTGSARSWDVEADGPRLRLLVVAGPRPADALRRLTSRIGRQPAPVAPWQWGPWFQTGHQNTEPDELEHVAALRRADAPVSAVETHMRYMPCAADRGRAQAERERTAGFHARGLAAITYVREAVCADDAATFADGVARGAFTRGPDGATRTYEAFVGGRTTQVAQIDFSSPIGDRFHADQLRRAVTNGYDGWMEDYGEYTPPDAVSADGTPAAEMRNRYPTLYHRSGHRFARSQTRPIVRFQRSGWTRSAPHAQIVWGGDPSTTWGFEGLRSSVTQALSMGLSGISTWGSDIGGFFSLTGPKLTPELLRRWIQFGAVSGVMRTKAEGIGEPKADRPQVWDRDVLPTWRRYTKLRTQLLPYLQAADAEYRRTGIPIMRHFALAFPGDRGAAAVEDAFGFGADLVAAPVLEPGARRRSLRLPAGRWIDVWQAFAYRERTGALELGRRPARLLRGGRRIGLDAPLDELPLLARAGTVLPLLPADVDTLADRYDTRSVTSLRERADRLRLLALPRGTSSARAGTDVRVTSSEHRRGWTLTVRARTARRVTVEASLATLRRPFRPRSVRVNGQMLPRSAWAYDPRSRVLDVRGLSGRRLRLDVR